MVKKRSVRSSVKKVDSKRSCKCSWNGFLTKIGSMAFILFLIKVWPWLNEVLLNVHWGIYLGIVVLIMIILGTKMCRKN